MNKVIREDIENIIAQDINWSQLKGSKVLITGASGMIAGYVIRTLLQLNDERDYDIEIYGLMRHPQKLEEDVRSRIQIIQQSVTEEIDTDVPFDYVLHMASPASPAIMKDDPVGTIGANTIGAWNTLKLADRTPAKAYLFLSSREIYGQPYERQEMFDENTYGFVDPLDPRSCYPEGKRAAETMCASYRKQTGLNTKIARLAHTFGPGMAVDDGRVQADFFRDVVNNRNILLKSTGSAVRTYTYVSDAVSAIFYILLNSPDDEMVYNISSVESTVSIRQLAEAMVGCFPEKGLQLTFDIPKEQMDMGTAPFTAGILSSEKIQRLGWSPKYSLEEGIRRTVEHLETEGIR